jgi:hypothetical protein
MRAIYTYVPETIEVTVVVTFLPSDVQAQHLKFFHTHRGTFT